MDKTEINTRYKINNATIERIENFKKFVGEENFEKILQGLEQVNIPFEEGKFTELMKICLDESPAGGYESIPYADAEEILSFFCKPFAGRSLKQAKYTMDGIFSLLEGMDPEIMTIAMESISSRKKKGTTSAVIN